MFVSKSRFINWTRCPMYFPMDLKHNPTGKNDIDAERERRAEMLEEMRDGAESSGSAGEEEEEFDASPNAELEALLPYYNKVEDEAGHLGDGRNSQGGKRKVIMTLYL